MHRSVALEGNKWVCSATTSFLLFIFKLEGKLDAERLEKWKIKTKVSSNTKKNTITQLVGHIHLIFHSDVG